MAKKKDPKKQVTAGQKSLTSFFAIKGATARPRGRLPENPVAIGTPVKMVRTHCRRDWLVVLLLLISHVNVHYSLLFVLYLAYGQEHPHTGNLLQFIDGTVIEGRQSEGATGVRYRVEFSGGDNDDNIVECTHEQVMLGQVFAVALGQKVRKQFGGKWFEGEVTLVWRDDDGTLQFRILYEDGDSEDMDEANYKRFRSYFDKKKGEQLNGESLTLQSRFNVPRSQTRVNAAMPLPPTTENQENKTPEKEIENKKEKRKRQSDSVSRSSRTRRGLRQDPDDDDDHEIVATSAGVRRRRTRAPIDYNEDSDFEFHENNESNATEEPMDVDDSDEIIVRRLPKGTQKQVPVEPMAVIATNNKVLIRTTQKTSNSEDNATLRQQEKLQKLHAKMAVERKDLKPQNNPQAMPDEPFVDPVGIDPTHGIVEGIISEQVRKVGELLKRVAERNEKGEMEKGELQFPIQLQTACSGTDAPSIALSLIQESLDHLFRDKSDKKHGFSFSHEMSCEIEPFKQAYIGRNFPGVPLFPDITKLTIQEEVIDVYGRPQRIPKGNLFVAGTSCKDFSMLKSNLRLDIEDKGTSGQTFLAAVEFLEKFEPEFFIFENVDGAPWDKMQEYISGRIQLSRRDDTTAITSSKTQAGTFFVVSC
jgi:hypothetical protein